MSSLERRFYQTPLEEHTRENNHVSGDLHMKSGRPLREVQKRPMRLDPHTDTSHLV